MAGTREVAVAVVGTKVELAAAVVPAGTMEQFAAAESAVAVQAGTSFAREMPASASATAGTREQLDAAEAETRAAEVGTRAGQQILALAAEAGRREQLVVAEEH